MTGLVYGIDPSLTSTGVASVLRGGPVRTWRVRSTGVARAPWPARWRRIQDVTARVCDSVTADGALVVMEAPSYGSASTSVHDRAGLWWALYSALSDAGAVVLPVSPSQRMKYATGSGRADKDAVLAAVVRRYLDVEVRGNDEADALVFAAIGARLVGAPLESSLPKTHLAALDKIDRRGIPALAEVGA